VPILSYASSWHWKFPNAPHDSAPYPSRRGPTTAGKGCRSRRAATCSFSGDAVAQARQGRLRCALVPKLTQWAQYLEQYGLDPRTSFARTTFMGPFGPSMQTLDQSHPRSRRYGDLCRMRGDAANAEKYQGLAKADAAHWMKVAADGDHYRLAFDKPNTWSQNYNLAWDRILGLNIFPPSVAQQEIAHYKKMMQKYGLPLDSRTHLTKTDWNLWRRHARGGPGGLRALISPLCDYLNQTTARSPFVDSYLTDQSQQRRHARATGDRRGVYQNARTTAPSGRNGLGATPPRSPDWAALPEPPKVKVVVPAADQAPATWHYTTARPGDDWSNPASTARRGGKGKAGSAPPAPRARRSARPGTRTTSGCGANLIFSKCDCHDLAGLAPSRRRR